MTEIKLDVNDLLSYAQAAEILEVSRPTIYVMVERGELHPFIIGSNNYLFRKEVEGLKIKRG